MDVGTSGGVYGLERGYCLMIGGDKDAVARLDPIFKTLAPGRGEVERTPGREKLGGTAEEGYLHCGPSGAGHFVKMVHNGIEYGMMQAYAEGLNVIRNANIGKKSHEKDAETTPLRDPQYFQYEMNVADITEVWRRGSVVASWLLDLTAQALAEPEPRRFLGQGLRLRRRTLDGARGRRRGRAHARALGVALQSRSIRAGMPTSRTRFSPRCGRCSAVTTRRSDGDHVLLGAAIERDARLLGARGAADPAREGAESISPRAIRRSPTTSR